ncbi:hypothetical protein BGX33_001821 [Mortierella sp. NVP41]|nr:hypothetical protein BGX33_001821 [Mortierella sp. NVP41]
MEAAKDKDIDIDTLEVLLNPGLIKTKACFRRLDRMSQVYLQGRRLLQDLLSIARFGTPTIVLPEPASGNRSDDRIGGGDEQQTMRLSERQDMLLLQACKVFFLASLSLDDVFQQVPQQNQLCLLTAMMLFSQKASADLSAINIQEEPWDALTLFQRWIVRSRVAGTENSGLDLGDTKLHIEALETKLQALTKVSDSPQVQSTRCQMSAELGQYYCWSGQYHKAIKYLDLCNGAHSLHLPSETTCHLDEKRSNALLKLAHLAVGDPLPDAQDNLLNRVKAMEREQRHDELVEEFKRDNVSKTLPYIWRQRLLWNVVNRSDYEDGIFLALYNALYRLGDPCEMMLEIPAPILQFLREIVFESGHEADAYLSSSIFEDIMEEIAETQTSLVKAAPIEGDKVIEGKFTAFVSKFCETTGHILCYDAAWKSGLLPPTQRDWSHVWDMYSALVARAPYTPQHAIVNPRMREAEELSMIVEYQDPADVESYLTRDGLPAFTSSLVTLALGAQASKRNRSVEAAYFLQSCERFIANSEMDAMTMSYNTLQAEFTKQVTITKFGIALQEYEDLRERRLLARMQQRINTNKTPGSAQRQDGRTEQDDNRMDTDEVPPANSSDPSILPTKDDDESVNFICQFLRDYLATYGPLDQKLQLRALAICINHKRWEFISDYSRASVERMDKFAYPAMFLVYSVLGPLSAILHGSQMELGVDIRDITAASCLEAFFSGEKDPLNINHMAALDMIQGLVHNATLPPSLTSTPMQPQQPAMNHQGEDSGGYAALLELFSMVRTRGVVDVFAALLAGALTSLLPERSKLTLSEFGYFALFSTSLECVGSWTDSRIKIIAVMSNGEAGAAVDQIPGAAQGISRLLIRLYEQQIRTETDSITLRMKVESKAKAELHLLDPLAHSSTLGSVSAMFSTKIGAHITRYSLCLTELYHLEGMYQEAVASFLNACMVASKCFSETERLNRRIWTVYHHGVSSSLSPIPPTVASPHVGLINGQPAGPSDPQFLNTFPTLSSLSATNGPPGFVQGGMTGNGYMNGNNGPGPVGLGMPPSIMEPNGPPNHAPTPPSNGPLPPVPQAPSSFALKAIESCMHLEEFLAGAVLQQFLPKMDYNQAFRAIGLAHENGMLTFSSGLVVVRSFPGSMAAPGMGGLTGGGSHVQSCTTIFKPEMKHPISERAVDTLLGRSLIKPGAPFSSHGGWSSHSVPLSLQGQQFLELVFDLSLLELVSKLCKETKNAEGLLRVQARINSNRMALDSRQPFRDQVHALLHQDVLVHLWSRFARIA